MVQLLDSQAFLQTAMVDRFAQLAETFDTVALHNSDNTNCVRAVWYRRNAYAETAITPQRRLTMFRGLAIEGHIVGALAEALERDGYDVYHAGTPGGQQTFWLAVDPDLYVTGGVGDDGPDRRAAIGHPDLYAINHATRAIYLAEVKSIPFLGPAPLTRHVIQAAGYEAAVTLAYPEYEARTHVVEVSAVTGEYRLHRLDRGAHFDEILARTAERAWNTAPGDEMPEPSIPDEAFVLRGRASNKKSVNLLCEKYCGFKMCEFNHVGEAEALVDE